MDRATCYLGVDLGGTQLRMAAVGADGCLVSEVISTPTGRTFGPSDLRQALVDLKTRLAQALDGRRAAALGFGTAGVVVEGRPLTQSENLPLLNGTDVARLVRDVAEVPVRLENDARCFTLAEARFGAGRGARDVCGITLGTGVGCGVMVDGRLQHGANFQAGEVWRIPLRGHHLEHFVSGAGIVRTFFEAGGEATPDLDAAGTVDKARRGEPAAVAAWQVFSEDLAFLCETVISLLDPSVIVIGGSLSQARDLYRPLLDERLRAHPATRIEASALGPAAGVIGAAALNIPSC
jgi:predicted NBD/HSP70 family sugar kinase